MMLEADAQRAFFRQLSTAETIQEIATRPQPITLYVGAGASIDRTGLSWTGLAQSLLRPLMVDVSPTDLEQAVCEVGAAAAISSAVRLHAETVATERQDRLNEILTALLYNPGRGLGGRITENIVELALYWRDAGRSVCIVTPNYDDYLFQELELAEISRDDGGIERFVAGDDALAEIVDSLERDSLTFVHLHGYLSSRSTSSRTHAAGKASPVLSEADYHNTADRTDEILRATLVERDLIVVGSALADPPLLRTLNWLDQEDQQVRSGTARRYAILPKQSFNSGPSVAALQLVRARCQHLGIKPVLPDFFIQVGQLFEEIRICADWQQYNEPYASPQCLYSYSRRLDLWWQNWVDTGGMSPDKQERDHRSLLQALQAVSVAVDSSVDEPLKLELWLRWYPHRQRHLALWASSVGTYVDASAARIGSLTGSSDYVSVRAFRSGAPTVFSVPPESDARWRTYVATPVWWQDPYLDAELPVGVVSLASMWSSDESSLGAQHRSALNRVVPLLREVGEKLVRVPIPWTTRDDESEGWDTEGEVSDPGGVDQSVVDGSD